MGAPNLFLAPGTI